MDLQKLQIQNITLRKHEVWDNSHPRELLYAWNVVVHASLGTPRAMLQILHINLQSIDWNSLAMTGTWGLEEGNTMLRYMARAVILNCHLVLTSNITLYIYIKTIPIDFFIFLKLSSTMFLTSRCYYVVTNDLWCYFILLDRGDAFDYGEINFTPDEMLELGIFLSSALFALLLSFDTIPEKR